MGVDNAHTHVMDPLYAKAMKFAENKKSSSGKNGISNIYVIQKTNMDGEVTGEYFGMNLMTDYGMSQYFVNNKTFPTKMFIGNGTSSFDHSSNTLISPVTTTTSTTSDANKVYSYPLYYDKTSGLITCVMRYLVAYFDYNVTGITESVAITEYGIGTAHNELWTHSWVYDISGEQTYITKDVNERLTFTVYLCMSYYESLITEGYNDDRYTVITTMQRFFSNMQPTGGYVFRRNNYISNKTCTNTTSAFMNNKITKILNMSQFTLENNATSGDGYIDGFVSYSPGFLTAERQTLDEPEAFDVLIHTPDGYANKSLSSISDVFGLDKDSSAPFTQADITSVALFNHKTGLFDNYQQYLNDSDKWYTETTMETSLVTPIYYTNNNTVIMMYLYQNIAADDPIVAFDNTLETIYATDKYWDSSSWVLITDIHNIPEALQKSRYWITSSNEESLVPIRTKHKLTLQPSVGDKYQCQFGSYTYGTFASCDSYNGGWFYRDKSVYVPSLGIRHDILNNSTSYVYPFAYENWLILITPNVSTMIVVNMTDTNNPIVETTELQFPSSVKPYDECYRSYSDTGIVCLQSIVSDHAVVLSLDGETPVQTVFNSKMSCAIWDENQIAYIPSDNTNVLRVYDFDSNGDIAEYAIPSDLNDVKMVFGHRNHIWITDCSTYTKVIDVSNGDISACDLTIPYGNHLQYIQATAVDDVFMLYNSYSTDTATVYFTKHDDPTVIKSLKDFSFNVSRNSSGMKYDLRYIEDKTLVLTIVMGYYYYTPGAFNCVVDFGQYLHDGTISQSFSYGTQMIGYTPYGQSIVCGNTIIPTVCWLTHRVIGTTNTISSINTKMNISGKSWSTTFTNIPEFNGVPSGTIQ